MSDTEQGTLALVLVAGSVCLAAGLLASPRLGASRSGLAQRFDRYARPVAFGIAATPAFALGLLLLLAARARWMVGHWPLPRRFERGVYTLATPPVESMELHADVADLTLSASQLSLLAAPIWFALQRRRGLPSANRSLIAWTLCFVVLTAFLRGDPLGVVEWLRLR